MGLVVLTLLLAAQEAPAAKPESPLAEFTRIGEALYAGANPVIGGAERKRLERALENEAVSGERRVRLLMALSDEELEQGDVEDAIATLGRALELGTQEQLDEKLLLRIHRALGLAWLRLAENQNCIERHNRECCVFPLAGGAIHPVREPAEAARREYELVLAAQPASLESRWLLNIAAMALGEYPDSVPEALRLPPAAFAPEAAAPRFRDVAAEAGVDGFNLAGGVAVEDYDGDGLLDILTSTCDPLGSLIYYRNRGDGTFADLSAESGAAEQLGGLNLVAGDVDNDGDQDALVLRGAWLMDDGRIRKSLLRNEGGKRFADVTRAAGLAEPAYPTQAAAFGDFDDDGWLDVYVASESRIEGEPTAPSYPSQLFKNRGDGTFVERAAAAGVTNDRYGKGVAAGDYDDDGDLDLFVSNIGTKRLYRNRGDGAFDDVAAAAGVAKPIGRTFACWFFDQDEDGRLDLWLGGYQTNIEDLAAAALGEPYECIYPCLYRNQGDGTFVDRARELGLARPMLPMGVNFGDIDFDGWHDLYLGTGEPGLKSLMPNVMLWSEGGKRYRDVTAATGLGQLQKGHGIAFVDFDGDGDQDIYHQLGGFFPVDKYRSALYENPGGSGNRWLYLSLVGTKTNRDAVGARVKLVLETPAGPRELHRAAGCVSSFGGSPDRLEIGLGNATRVARLEVRWPRSRTTQVFEDVPLDAWVRATEGEEDLARLELTRFSFAAE
jgi:hypothetical protein